MKLVVGNCNYSSWSLRGWLAARQTGADFETVVIDLDTPEFKSEVARHSSAGRVPVLVDGDITVWDSLAIIEYLAEQYPDCGLWPADKAARAFARSVSAEMHSGFPDVRNHWPMNIRRPIAERPATEGAARDTARITEIWREARKCFGQDGPFLCGAFGAIDCVFAPVASRFRTYGVELGPVEAAYVDAIHAHPPMVEWIAAAKKETWVVVADEVD
ncbi:Stringent starvation protein A [Hartmannibacter diazotrophicus]|uniref:Stringent starvation protein A n=1 Tax=Hartmannibacter diazotrophicus TaxID=1482074 RepID=A0A2C9D4N7_9HYPH|nr:glutathione S-transferase family protein [Hartmannibacter diazotrophicus]SON55160.1 Stringent starvation protein A [Hartmannibacter diazotrophicus]